MQIYIFWRILLFAEVLLLINYYIFCISTHILLSFVNVLFSMIVLRIVCHNSRVSKPTKKWKGSRKPAVIIRGAFTIHTFLPWTNNNAGCNNWWCRKFRTDLKGVSMETLPLSFFIVKIVLCSVFIWAINGKGKLFFSEIYPPVFILIQSVFILVKNRLYTGGWQNPIADWTFN